MANLRIKGDVSGYVDLVAPAVAGSQTVNLDKLVEVNSNGYLGVGTTNPTVGLELSGTGNTTRFKIIDGSDQVNFGLWDGTNYRLEGDANRKILITSYHTDGIHLGASGGSDLVVKGNKVGIGTSNPNVPLTLHGNMRFYTTNADSNEQRALFNVGGTSDPFSITMYQADATTIGAKINAGGTSYFNGGNVGIGTASPSTTLHVLSTSSLPQARIAYDANRYLSFGHSEIWNVSGAGQTNDLRISTRGNSGNNNIRFSTGATDASTEGTERLRITSTANMVHVKGDTADHSGTGGGSKGLSLATAGGTSCPLYFGSETNSAQKSMYMNGYWIYLRGHQNEGIRFVFSQGGGTAIRSDQYQFKYNSAYRPTGNTTWDGFSDARAKENVTNLTNALDTISQLRPVSFDWTDDYADTMNMFEMDTTDEKSYNHFSVKENGYDLDRKTSQIGFIAQEFEEVFPKSITETEMQLGDTKVEDFKTVNYDHLIPVLTKAVQELKAENDALKARIEALEGQ